MFPFFRLWFGLLARCFRSHHTLLLENLALRQQLTVLKRKQRRPKVSRLDKLFWVLAHRFCSAWKSSLIIVTPETVVRWHRAGFRLYWSLISRVKKQVGRKRLSKEIRNLIFRMVAENPTWGAPRIHGELLMLGFDVSERSRPKIWSGSTRWPSLPEFWRATGWSLASIQRAAQPLDENRELGFIHFYAELFCNRNPVAVLRAGWGQSTPCCG
jgi:hypothetical protein